MTFRMLMIVTAVVTIGFGTGFIIAPAQLVFLYGLSSTPVIEFALRLYATALIGIGVLAWLFRKSHEISLQRRVLAAFFIIDFGGLLVALLANLSGILNFLGWSLVILFLLFSAMYIYLIITSKDM